MVALSCPGVMARRGDGRWAAACAELRRVRWLRGSFVVVAVLVALPIGSAEPRPRAADVDATVVQVGLVDGKEISRVSLGRERSVGPMVVSSRVLVLQRVRCLQGDGTQARGDSEVTGTDPQSGATRWRLRDVGIAGGYEIPQLPPSASTVLLVDTVAPKGQPARVHLVDTATGKVRWSRPATTTRVLAENDDLLVATDEPVNQPQPANQTGPFNVRGVDRTTGRDLWSARIDNVAQGGAAAVASSNLVVVSARVKSSETGRDQTTASAYDAKTGALVATYAVNGTVTSLSGESLITSQALRSATGYAARTGTQIWERTDLYVGDLASSQGEVLLGTKTNRPLQWIALDPTTGMDGWSLNVDYYTAVLSNTDVGIFGYAGPGVETALNLADGSTRWKQPPPSLTKREYSDDEVQPAYPRAIGTKVAAYGIGCATSTAT